jgi:hypothetical protein
MSSSNIPYAKPFIFRLINSLLEEHVDPEQYELGLPRFTLGEFNTQITIRPLRRSFVLGKTNFNYNRLNLADLQPIVLVRDNEQLIHDLLPRINELPLLSFSSDSPLRILNELGVPYFGETEIIQGPIPPFGSADRTFFYLQARPNSYVFTGQTEITLLRP